MVYVIKAVIITFPLCSPSRIRTKRLLIVNFSDYSQTTRGFMPRLYVHELYSICSYRQRFVTESVLSPLCGGFKMKFHDQCPEETLNKTSIANFSFLLHENKVQRNTTLKYLSLKDTRRISSQVRQFKK